MGSFTSGKFCLPHSKRDYHIGLQKFNLHSLLKHMALKAQQVLLMAEIRKKEMTMYRNIFQWVWCVGLLHILLVSSPASLIQIDFCSLFLVKGEKTQSQVPPFVLSKFSWIVKMVVVFYSKSKKKNFKQNRTHLDTVFQVIFGTRNTTPSSLSLVNVAATMITKTHRRIDGLAAWKRPGLN